MRTNEEVGNLILDALENGTIKEQYYFWEKLEDNTNTGETTYGGCALTLAAFAASGFDMQVTEDAADSYKPWEALAKVIGIPISLAARISCDHFCKNDAQMSADLIAKRLIGGYERYDQAYLEAEAKKNA